MFIEYFFLHTINIKIFNRGSHDNFIRGVGMYENICVIDEGEKHKVRTVHSVPFQFMVLRPGSVDPNCIQQE
jgi:hypothetical protein